MALASGPGRWACTHWPARPFSTVSPSCRKATHLAGSQSREAEATWGPLPSRRSPERESRQAGAHAETVLCVQPLKCWGFSRKMVPPVPTRLTLPLSELTAHSVNLFQILNTTHTQKASALYNKQSENKSVSLTWGGEWCSPRPLPSRGAREARARAIPALNRRAREEGGSLYLAQETPCPLPHARARRPRCAPHPGVGGPAIRPRHPSAAHFNNSEALCSPVPLPRVGVSW